ncbi:porin, LamB family [Klebsiella pneumoniae]|nr:Maltoporin (maltose/maltodextrin high-affinity receptor, phage lambda receptor protein) [Klebsiella pneumoniae IS39]STV84151.1 porin, LamB family [Klebsiella pneumoniae]
MNTTLRALSVALAAALIAPSAFAATAAIPTIDFHGYMRAGVGVSGDGSEAEWQKK